MVIQWGYCKRHYISWDSNIGGCPICKLNKEVNKFYDTFENVLDQKDELRVQKI